MSRIHRLLRLLPSDRHERAIAAEHELRAPLPVIRRVAFAAIAGGTGCSTAARRAAEVLSARRSGGVLLVDAAGAEPRPEPVTATRFETCAVPPPVWPDGIENWRARCGEPHRSVELTLTDWGMLGLTELSAVAAHSHLVCVTTTPERAAVQLALDAASFLADSGTAVLLVASAVRGRPTVGARRMLAALPVPSLLLPYDRAARQPGSVAIGEGSTPALARLGAAIVGVGARSGQLAGAA